MLFKINPSDEVPVYHQIVLQVKEALVSGQLKPGDKMPTHRDLAAELVIAPMTVKKAYDVLDREGLLMMQAGKGTFITDAVAELSEAEVRKRFGEKIKQLIREAALLGLSREKLYKLLDEEYDRIKSK